MKVLTDLKSKYRKTAWFYDILDYPWERRYRHWRGPLLQEVYGKVLEVGVGTGRNLAYYPPHISLTGVDLSNAMLKKASQRLSQAKCQVELFSDDATKLEKIETEKYDWMISTFLYCVLPDELQLAALEQCYRILKPGGRFKILEIIYSKDYPKTRRPQKFLAKFVEKIYGARFDRKTLEYLNNFKGLSVSKTSFLHQDTYLLIEGSKS